MMNLNEQEWRDLARAASASGTIIEAHSDADDTVSRVVIELSESLRNAQLREAVMQLWLEDGFIAYPSRDQNYLMIEGIRRDQALSGMDLVNLVAHQLKQHMRGNMKTRTTHRDVPVELLARAAKVESLGLPQ